jgi:phenylalanyl-tRNA synthetase beta subunit
MKFSFNWLKELSGFKGSAAKMAELIKLHAFDVKNVEKLGADFIFDIDVLPNRAGDCFSHMGMAREVSVAAKTKLKEKVYKINTVCKGIVRSSIKVSIKNPELCSRYIACLVQGVTVKESPKWLKDKLISCGLKPINNIVDATNYAMLLSGQPIHAFDFKKLNDHEITVRAANKGEKMTTLHGETLTLDPSALVIADSKVPLALAGIKGGMSAEITKDTKELVIEAAIFEPQNIRKTARKTGIRTDASLRFEHGVSDWNLELGLDAVLSAITENAGGVLCNKYDVDYRKHYHRKVSFSVDYLKRFIGNDIEEKEVLGILGDLGFDVSKTNVQKLIIDKAQRLLGKPYKYGVSTFYDAPEMFDCSSFTRYVFREAGIEIPRVSVKQLDFAEHVALDDLEPGDLVFSRGDKPHMTKEHPDGIGHVGLYIGRGQVIHASGKAKKVVKENVNVFVKNNWRGAGRITDVTENKLLAFVPPFRQDILTKEDLAEEIIRIKGYNNLVSEMPHVKIHPLQQNDELNAEAKIKNIFYHLGFAEAYNYSFVAKKDPANFLIAESRVVPLKNPASEDSSYLRPNLAIHFVKNTASNFRFFDAVKIFETGHVFYETEEGLKEGKKCGFVYARKKQEKKKGEMFFEAKGFTENMLQGLGIDEYRFKDIAGAEENSFYVKSAQIFAEEARIGVIGYIRPEILKKYDINFPVVVCEMDQDELTKIIEKDFEYVPISKYPAVIRDLSILVGTADKVDDVLNVIEIAGGEILFDTDLFDIYENEKAQEDDDMYGKKSLAFHLVFQSDKKTLTDEEVNGLMKKIMGAVEDSGWEVRK